MNFRKLLHLPFNRNRNIRYDFGLGKRGSIIDFDTLYHKCSIPEILQLLSGNFSQPNQLLSVPVK